jgi:hypothetical protein
MQVSLSDSPSTCPLLRSQPDGSSGTLDRLVAWMAVFTVRVGAGVTVDDGPGST